ncbi:MAG: cystathionine beta-lyase [Rhodospirillales bacterium]|nr:cystathionine beta-lyase [Rhodospirillales bacterium]
MKDDTILTHAGREPFENHGIVNPPVYHASTILFPTMAAYLARHKEARVRYGLSGTPTTFALEEAVTALEGHGAHGTVAVSSGLAAITMPLCAFVEAGDHILITDSTYAPTRKFADSTLQRLGVESEFYDPLIGAGIEDLIRPNTRLIWLESPGSHTFEVQDVPAITEVARAKGVRTIIDNTWGAGYYFKAFKHGVDVSIQAGTKYIAGHSDVINGTITCNEETYEQVKQVTHGFGVCCGPDDVYLTLRGLRTMGVRLQRHHENGIRIAKWLQDRPEVIRVMHPALPQDPGHAIWQRDFTGACGLFGFVVDTDDRDRVAVMIDGMKLYGIGSSWGGFESLLIPSYPEDNRTATTWEPGGHTLRIHVGLEDPDDLIDELDKGLNRMKNSG